MLAPPRGYFDAASAVPLHPLAREAYLAAAEDGWADPARLYRAGRQARRLLDAARESLAAELGARPDELAFTTSGTHALHLGVLGTLAARRRTGRHLVHSAVEHSAVLHACESAEVETTAVPVDRQARVSPEDFAAALRPDTALASLQSANHEVGTLQPVAEAAAACARRGIPLLVDAAQTAGRLPVPDGWSLLAASAHKWGGPPGVGVLAVRKGTRYRSPLPADDRLHGTSANTPGIPGFPDIPAITAAAVALRAARAEAAEENARLRALTDRLRARVPELVPDVSVLGPADPADRLPHLVTFSCLYVDGEALLSELDRSGFALSSGSSCTSSTLTPSHVLAAMGVLTEGNLRVSLPDGTPDSEIDRFLAVLPGAVASVRAQLSPAAPAARNPASATDSPVPAAPRELVLDTLGRRCPVPIIELAKHLTEVPVGGTIVVVSDDEAARLDVPAWCRMREQEYLGESPGPEHGLPSGTGYSVRRLS